jgi:hypothetical protein
MKTILALIVCITMFVSIIVVGVLNGSFDFSYVVIGVIICWFWLSYLVNNDDDAQKREE